MFKQVKQYVNDYKPMAWYTDGKMIKTVAFIFLTACYVVGYLTIGALLLATAPVWVIPYCIYTGRKERL